jgi:integrase
VKVLPYTSVVGKLKLTYTLKVLVPAMQLSHQINKQGKNFANDLKAILLNAAPKIEVNQGKYRIRLPRYIAADDSKRRICTRLEATEANYPIVARIAIQIDLDLHNGTFDQTLERYKEPFKPKTFLKVVPSLVPALEPKQQPQTKPDLLQLWDKYSVYMKPQLAETTYQKDYVKKYRNHIEKLPTKDLEKAVEIKDYILGNLTANTAKRVLTYLSACCNWAVKSKLIPDNPFKEMSEDIKLPRKDSESIDPFTASERDAIIQAFENHPHYHHYASFVKFQFMTGARTGESIALTWGNISPDCKLITFSESYDGATKIRKSTKTGKTRKFPCNDSLQKLLLSIRPETPVPNAQVFYSPTGGLISNTRFSNQVWKGCKAAKNKKPYKGVVTELVNQGLIERYRCFYNTRHTFITLALESGLSVSQVAKIAGNSPKIILDHYASSVLKIEIPEF